MNKFKNILGNSLWQIMPSVFTLLLSLAVVRFFSTGTWGMIVNIIVVQQMTNSLVSWGNKDFLQREIAIQATEFRFRFSGLFCERLLLLCLVMPLIYCTGFIAGGYFIAFVLLVLGRFFQQSFDILIIKERKFTLAITLELSFLILQLGALLALKNKGLDSIPVLLAVFWVPALAKSLLLAAVFRHYFTFKKPHGFLLPKAFFFAMLSLSGLVHSKIDVLLVSKLLDAETLGKYQIIMAFSWNIQSAAMYISGPYVHNFYRLSGSSQRNYSLLLRKLGLLIVPAGVAVMLFLLHFAFGIAANWPVVLASLLFSAMSFIYLPWILQINSKKQESRVLLINVAGTAVLVLFILAANQVWGLTLQRMLWIITIQQLFLTIAAFAANKTPKVCLQP